eukprot:UN3406
MSTVLGQWSSFEKLNSDAEDILGEAGLQLLRGRLLAVAAGGLLWLGTPCKSWVALSRSWSCRSTAMPQGPVPALCSGTQHKYLHEHSTIAGVTALLLRTSALLGLRCTLEQPLSSLLFSRPCCARCACGYEWPPHHVIHGLVRR